jgi:hypothetical protein
MAKKVITYIVMFFTLASCTLFKPDLKYEPKTVNEYYFPSLSADFKKAQSECIEQKKFPCDFPKPNDSLSDFVNSWYSKHLVSLKEPRLYNKKNKGLKIIRFTHLGTWSNPYSYRIEKNNENIIGTYNRTKGLGGYEAGRRIEHVQKDLDKEKWNKIIAKVDSVDFWNIHTHDPNMILDGAEWILEILIDDKYHIVTRNSPDVYDGKNYADLCKYIINSFEK